MNNIKYQFDSLFFYKNKIGLILGLGLMLFFGCDKAPIMPDPDPNRPIADFQFEVVDTFTVNFSDFSTNGDTYAWDFGDGNTSTEAEPSHRYTAEGSYTITLTITSVSDLTASTNQIVDIMIPIDGGTGGGTGTASLLEQLAGTAAEGKTWVLRREAGLPAFGIGPAAQDVQWYGLGTSDPLESSPCTMDDEYTFLPDGSLIINTNGSFTLDEEQFGGWNDNVSSGCNFESTPGLFTSSTGIDMSAFRNGGSYTFQVDDVAETVRLIGDGVYIANPAKGNMGDLGSSAAPHSELTYSIASYTESADKDELVLVMAVDGGGSFWTFWLVNYKDPATTPAQPGAVTFEGTALSSSTGKTWKLANIGSYRVGPTPGSNEWWAGPTEADVTGDRACQMDDEFIFFDNGAYSYNAITDTWTDDYISGLTNTCADPTTFPAPFDGLASANNYTFALDNPTNPTQVTVNGTGAFIGFSKPHNNGEYTSADLALQTQVTYDILSYRVMGNTEQLELVVDYCGGGCFWTITIEATN